MAVWKRLVGAWVALNLLACGNSGDDSGGNGGAAGRAGSAGAAGNSAGAAAGAGGTGGTGGTAGAGASPGLLEGDPNDDANAAIPDLDPEAGPDDYTELPDSDGVLVSESLIGFVPSQGATVSQINALLTQVQSRIIAGLPPLVPGAQGWLMLQLDHPGHAEVDAAIGVLRSNSAVELASRDYPAVTQMVPKSEGTYATCDESTTSACWKWGSLPAGGNWGHELLQVPQAWNLWDHLRQKHWPDVLLIDGGFADHPDLAYAERRSITTDPESLNHGTAVAGLFAAKHDGTATDGVVPTASIYAVEGVESGMRMFIQQTFRRILEFGPDVVNTSMAYVYSIIVNPETDADVRADMESQAAMFLLNRLQLDAMPNVKPPVIVVAAGNDSRHWAARWASPACAVAIDRLADGVHCVEALKNSGAGASEAAAFSNLGGTVAAPGEGILSLSNSSPYSSWDGTSFASPYFAAQVAYLFAADPNLTAGQIDLIVTNSAITQASTGTAARWVPLFDALLTIDQIRGSTSMRELLLDVDDGTADGDLRVDAQGQTYTADELSHPTGPRTHTIDMADFRRWRDWYLLVNHELDNQLDGPPEHEKRDVNHNGSVASSGEDTFPRGDFNGDGSLLEAARSLPGFGSPQTDLDVLRTLFDDANYSEARLPALVESGDVHFHPEACLSLQGVTQVRTNVLVGGSPYAADPSRTTLGAAPVIHTLPVGAYTARLEALDASGTVVATNEREVEVGLGSDDHLVGCATRAAWAATNTEDWDSSPDRFWMEYNNRWEPVADLPLDNSTAADAMLTAAGGTRSASVKTSGSGFCLEGSATSVYVSRPFCTPGQGCRHWSRTASAVVFKPSELALTSNAALSVIMDSSLQGGSVPCGGSDVYVDVWVWDVAARQYIANAGLQHEQFPPDAATRSAYGRGDLGWTDPAPDAVQITLPFDVTAYDQLVVEADVFAEIDCEDGSAAAIVQVDLGNTCTATPTLPVP